MPFDLEPVAALWIAAGVFAAGLVRGYSGFGFAALVLGFAGLVANPILFVPVVVIADVVLSLAQIPALRGEIAWRRVAPMFAGAFLAVPAGVAVVARMGDDLARLVISLAILAATACLWAGWTIRRPMGALSHAGAGVVSGIAQGASLGGLPVAVFFAAQPIPPAIFRATVIAYFFLIDLWAFPVMWQAGLVTRDTLLVAALSLPFMGAGVWYGSRHFRAATPQGFRRFALLLLTGLGLAGLVRALA